jgi:hypothetical protein
MSHVILASAVQQSDQDYCLFHFEQRTNQTPDIVCDYFTFSLSSYPDTIVINQDEGLHDAFPTCSSIVQHIRA